jgi:hypothetical protein
MFSEFLADKLQYLEDNFSEIDAAEQENIKDEITAMFVRLPQQEQAVFNQEVAVIPDDLDFSTLATLRNIASKLYSFQKMH